MASITKEQAEHQIETVEEARQEGLEHLGKAIDKFQDSGDDKILEILEEISMDEFSGMVCERKELYVVVNTRPNTQVSGTHRDLTIVNRPEALDTPAIYQENKLEEAQQDREQLVEQFGNEDLEVKKLTVDEVNQ